MAVASAKGYAYLYDHLNRIGRMTSYDITGNQWQNLQGPSMDASSLYASYNYDANGNITKLVRNNASLTLNRIDSFEYHYEKDVNNRLVSNKLFHVTEKAPATPSYDGDIEAMGTFTSLGIQTNNNYVYDNIGNLVKDKSERIDEIVWNVYGKIQEIKRETTLPAHQKSDLVFEYDPSGNRIVKIEKPRDISGNILPSNQWIYDYYVRDASGNIMANYSAVGNQVIWTTSPLYGSSRLGVLTKNTEIIDASGMLVGFSLPDDYEYQRGEIQFELSNHLGNVLAVVSDRKMAARSAGPGNWQHFNVAYSSFSDYYPFGMLIKERSFSSDIYRFGFNGKEKDNDISGEGNIIAFEARIYDARLCRFFSCDPLESDFPWQSPYLFASNCPIALIDYLGMSAVTATIDDESKTDNKGENLKSIKGMSQSDIKNNQDPTIEDPKDGPNTGNCGISIYDVKIIKRLGRLFRPRYWVNNGKRRWVDDFICNDNRTGKCNTINGEGESPNSYMKKYTPNRYLRTIRKTRRDIERFEKRQNRQYNFGLRINNLVIYDININSTSKPNEVFFPGRQRADGSYSQEKKQYFYRVKEGTSRHSHPERGHFFMWSKMFNLTTCTTLPSCSTDIDR